MNERHLVGVDLNLLLVFRAVWRERSVTRAAAWLRVSQSAASHALGRLRTLSGDPLFVRSDTGVAPTPQAEAMAVDVAIALDRALAALRAPGRFDPTTAEGVIRLGLTDYASAVIFPAFVARVAVKAPRLRVEGRAIDARDFLADLDRGIIDLAFGPAPPPAKELRSQKLYAEKLVCVVDAAKWKSKRMSLDDYLAHPHLVVSYDGDATAWVDRRLSERGLNRRVQMVLPHALALADVLKGTSMICTIAEKVALRGAPLLAIFEHPLEQRQIEVHAIWTARTDADPMHNWVRNELATLFDAGNQQRAPSPSARTKRKRTR